MSDQFNILHHATIIPMKKMVYQVQGWAFGELVARDVDINALFVTGMGYREPLGILNSAAVVEVCRMRDGVVALQDCHEMLNKFFFSGGGVWLFSPTAYAQFGRDVNCEFHELDIINKALFGMPIHICHSSPERGKRGDVILANLEHYIVGHYKDDGDLFDGYPAGGSVTVGGDEKYNFVALGGMIG